MKFETIYRGLQLMKTEKQFTPTVKYSKKRGIWLFGQAGSGKTTFAL